MTQRLLDIVPLHVRFSDTKGATPTRNVIIRSTATATVALDVSLPGPPFRVVLGAERVKAGLQLSPGETLPLRIALDTAFPLEGHPVCDFIVVQADLCRPMAIDVVATPAGTAEDEVKRLVATRQEEVLAARVHEQPGSTIAGQPVVSPEVTIQPSGVAAPSGTARKAMPTTGTETTLSRQPPAALAEYLGEAPAGAALRPEARVPARGRMLQDGQLRSRGGDDSPDDNSPELVAPRGATRDFDDDRPPTPAPAGFEAVDEGCIPQNFCSVRHSPRRGSRPASAGRPPLEKSVSMSAALRRGRTPQKEVASKEDEGLFFLEGVGWCDEYGRTVEVGADGTRRPKPVQSASGTTSLETTAKPMQRGVRGPSPAQSRGNSLGRPAQGSTRSQGQASGPLGMAKPKRMSPQERDAAWEALGGI